MEIMNKGYKNSFELDHRFIEIPSSNIDADKKRMVSKYFHNSN